MENKQEIGPEDLVGMRSARLVVGVMVCCVAGIAAPPDRLHGGIGEAAIALPGNIRPEATADLAPVFSVSYGGCEAGSPARFRSVAQQANAEGITWMSAAGGSSAARCDGDATVATHGPSVIFPANIPEVTAVGGTRIQREWQLRVECAEAWGRGSRLRGWREQASTPLLLTFVTQVDSVPASELHFQAKGNDPSVG
jgi:hypothetical protein